MALTSLLVCRDQDVMRLFKRGLDEISVNLNICAVADAAAEKLARNKYDAVIVDCDDVSGSTNVFQGLHEAPSSRRAITLAIISGKTTMRQAFEMGAHFVLEKPLTLERVNRSLRAAHGFMIAEQRRYFRHAVEMAVMLTLGEGKQLQCHATNISEGGMALKMASPVSTTANVELRFELPGVPERLHATGEFAWTEGDGRAGIRFVHVPYDSKKVLTAWLAAKMDEGGGDLPRLAARNDGRAVM